MSLWKLIIGRPPSPEKVLGKVGPYSLGDLQQIFSLYITYLIQFAYKSGYTISVGEFLRLDVQAEANAKSGAGIKNSLHKKKLAADLNLFKAGKYLSETSAHKPLGDYWESLSTEHVICHWGGKFGDGNHYSIGYKGIK